MISHPCISLVQVKRASFSGNAGNIAAVAAVTGKKIRVLQIYLRQAAAGTVQFQSSTTSNLSGAMTTTTADLEIAADLNVFGHFETVAGEQFTIAAGTAAVQGWLCYQEIGGIQGGA